MKENKDEWKKRLKMRAIAIFRARVIILLPFQASPPSFLTSEGEVGGEVELGSTVEEIQQSPRATRVFGRRGGTQVNKAAICYQPNPRVSVVTLSS